MSRKISFIFNKKYVMHFLTHSEKYHLVIISALALIWNFNFKEKWPEPLI